MARPLTAIAWERIRHSPKLTAAVVIFVVAYVHQWIAMMHEQQQQQLYYGMGGGGGGGGWGRSPPTRDEVVTLLRQVLPPGAPQPTDEEIDFLTEQFHRMEPGTALSFNPSLLGQTLGGSLERLQIDLSYGPPPLVHSDDGHQERCVASTVEGDDVQLLPPTKRFQVAARSIPRVDAAQTESDVLRRDQNEKADECSSHKRHRLVESMPVDVPARPSPSSTSNKPFNHSSIREVLRKVKDQVRAVERLRSSIELEERELLTTVSRSRRQS